MKDLEQKEIIAMLAVIYKKLDALDRKVNNPRVQRFPPLQWLVDELREEAAKVIDQIDR